MKQWFAISLCAAALGACKKDPGEAGGGGGGGGGGGAATDLPAAVAAWMPKDAKQLWQGAFSTRLTLKTSGAISMAGDPAALQITGDKVRAFDGTTEHALDLELDSPCTVGFKKPISEGAMKGGVVTFPKKYAIQGGKLLVGDGAVGYRKGKAALACTTDGVHVLDESGACKAWDKRFGKWESKDATCAWQQADGKDVLVVGTGDWATKLVADGDLLMTDQFRDEVPKTVVAADFEAAKAALAK